MEGFTQEEVQKWLEAEIALKTVELMEKNEELETALRKLEVLDKTKNEFLQIISHEIRTPLNGIHGSLYLLKDELNDPVQKEFFDLLEISIRRLEHFARTALQIVQLQAGGRRPEKELLPVKDLIREIESFTNSEGKVTTAEYHIDPDIVSIPVNRSLFLTALIRIYRNAVKFSPDAGVITTTVTREEEGIHFIITDQGPGFPEDVLLHKFEPFVTAETHIDENPGLSLVLVRYVVEAHGGKIDIYNLARGGGAVDFYIPEKN